MVVAMTTTKPPLSVRVSPDVKAALALAARERAESSAVLAEKVIAGWLKLQGYLPKKGKEMR